MTMLEFWPDYGPGPLWTDKGKPVDLAALGVDRILVDEVHAWNAAYDEGSLPSEGSSGDDAWLREGRCLLDAIRVALGGEYRIVVTEPWWGELPTDLA